MANHISSFLLLYKISTFYLINNYFSQQALTFIKSIHKYNKPTLIQSVGDNLITIISAQ